jgi:hypothetical protein
VTCSIFRALSSVVLAFVVHGSLGAEPQQELRSGAEDFAKLVENRDLPALLSRFSEQGASFVGTAYVPLNTSLSPQAINKDFETKTGVYCLFFDTSCLREEDSKERTRHNGRPLNIPLRSVIDLLATAKAKRFVTYDNLSNGKVSLILSDRTPDTARLGQDALNFYFRFEQGQWKLRNLEYN